MSNIARIEKLHALMLDFDSFVIEMTNNYETFEKLKQDCIRMKTAIPKDLEKLNENLKISIEECSLKRAVLKKTLKDNILYNEIERPEDIQLILIKNYLIGLEKL